MKILVAADYSDASKQAVDAAARLAQDMSATLVLVHVVSKGPRVPGHHAGPVDPITEVQREIQRDEAIELSTKWAAPLRALGLEVETAILEGNPAEALVAAAEEYDVGLLVLGRRGWGKVKRFMLGSVTEDVVRKATRPVLVVP